MDTTSNHSSEPFTDSESDEKYIDIVGEGRKRKRSGVRRQHSYAIKGLSETEITELRTKINHRERKRMHDLNEAMDSLREVMPYARGPSVRKLSKIATITMARNCIQMLTKSVDEMKKLLDDIYRNSSRNSPPGQTNMLQMVNPLPPQAPVFRTFSPQVTQGYLAPPPYFHSGLTHCNSLQCSCGYSPNSNIITK